MENFLILNSVTETDFGKKLEKFFRLYVMCSESFDWEALLQFAKSNLEELLRADEDANFQLFCKLFLELFSYFNCPSLLLMNKLINVYIELDFSNGSRNAIRKRENPRSKLELYNRPSLILRSLNDTDNFSSSPILVFRRTLNTIYRHRVHIMKLLVKNGLCCLPPDEYFMDFRGGYLLPFAVFKIIADDYMPEVERIHAWTEIIKSNVKMIVKRPTRRIILMLMTVELLIYTECSRADYVECLRLLYRTTPDSYVTHQDLVEHLTNVYSGLNASKLVQTLVENLQKEFPEITRYYQPRALLHLCRVKIREGAFEKREILPQAMAKLNIPQKVKKFIFADGE